LILDQKYEYILTEAIFHRRHIVLRMRNYAWLENCSQIGWSHPVEIRLGRKYGKKVEDVEQ
jgi:hypothetical protein